MIKQSPGKIYLSGQRGITQTRQFCRYSTFNFGAYVHTDKSPFGRLYVCNEEIIAPSQHISFEVAEDTHIILIPVTGDIQCKYGPGKTSRIEVEQIMMLTLPANSAFQVVNPYAEEAITLLQLWIKADKAAAHISSQLCPFTFSSLNNQLLEIIPGNNIEAILQLLPFSLCLGCFTGRKDSKYVLSHKNTAFFAFVLDGAFELEGRLLHAGDALSLWNVTEVELEALSAQALLLTIEIQPL